MGNIGVIGLPGAWSTETLADAIEKETGFRLVIDCNQISLDLNGHELFYKDSSLNDLDGIIIKKIGTEYSTDLVDRLELLRLIEEMNKIKFFSKPKSIINLINRLSCTITLESAGIPMPKTFLTEDIDQAKEFIFKQKKVVLKPLFTSKARGMTIVTSEDDMSTIISEYKNKGNQMLYIQKVIENIGKDYGVSFLGGKYIGTYARVKTKNTWNTTTNSGGVYERYEPSPEIIEIAQKAQSLFNLDFTCVDVVETDEGPKVFEVSAFGGFRGLKEACNVDVAKDYTNYVLRKINEK